MTARGRTPLRRGYVRVLRGPNSLKQDELAARQLHALKQHFAGRLRLVDVRQMFVQVKDQL